MWLWYNAFSCIVQKDLNNFIYISIIQHYRNCICLSLSHQHLILCLSIVINKKMKYCMSKIKISLTENARPQVLPKEVEYLPVGQKKNLGEVEKYFFF